MSRLDRVMRGRLRLLLGFAVVPLVFAVWVSVARLGADARHQAAREDVRFGDELGRLLTGGARPAPDRIPVLDPLLLRLSRRPPDYDVGVYSGDRLELRFNTGELPEIFPAPLLDSLRSRAASFATRLGERPVSITPIKDSAQSNVIGLILVVRRAEYPTALPRSPLFIGFGAILLVSAACLQGVWRHRHRVVQHLPIFVPGLAFLVYMLTTQDTPAPNELETFRSWSVLSIGLWTVIVAIGIILDSRTHHRPSSP